MAYTYSTHLTYIAFLSSWGYYFSGRPVGTYAGATTLLSGPRVGKPRRHTFVKASQMAAAKRQHEEQQTVSLLGLCKEMPLDLVLTSEDPPEDETEGFAPPTFTIIPSCEPDETPPPTPTPPPSPLPKRPASKLTKRKREPTPELTPDDIISSGGGSGSDDDSDDEVVRPQKKRKMKLPSPIAATSEMERDEQLARQLHQQMNGRGSRRRKA